MTTDTSSTTTAPARVVVVSAGLRSPSTTTMLATELSEAVVDAFALAGRDVDLQTIEVREYGHLIVDAMTTGFPSPKLQQALDLVTSADALVVVTPTFSASYSGLFKSFIDIIEPDALVGMPMILGATAGTERHSLMIEHAMRPLFTYLGADPVRTGVFAATADFGGNAGSQISDRAARAATELVHRVDGASPARPVTASAGVSEPGDETPEESLMADFVPFEQLLARMSRD